MSRRICVLPQGFSEACAADCDNGHPHKSAREIIDLEAKGEVEFHDLHPVRKTARYVQRVHNTQRNHISAAIIERAAGAYEIYQEEVGWARRKVDSHGKSDLSTFNSLVAQYRRVELPRIVWSDDGIQGNFSSDGAAAPRGKTVAVNLKPRTPETIEAASSVWRFMTMRQATIRALAKSRMREWKESLKRLDGLWTQIVAEFSAGPFSEQLRDIPASQLPSVILYRVLEAFLQS